MKASICCLGDVHGAFEQLLQVVAGCPKDADVWQLGDLGFDLPLMAALAIGPHFKFLRGNRDNPVVTAKHPNYAGNFGYDPENRLFFLSGAASHEHKRASGVDWWPDEELDNEQMEAAYRKYVETKPDIVLSHTAPSGIVLMLCREMNKPKRERECQSRTSQILHQMLLAHQPRVWAFAHFHVDWQRVLTTHGGKPTQFVCCDRLREGQPAKVFFVPEELNAPKLGDLVLAPASA